VPAAEPHREKAPERPAGWARGAAYAGFGLGAVVLVLTVAAEILGSANNFETAGWLMVASGVLTVAGGPIVYGGGSSARFDKSVYGSKLFRVLGWITYGVSITAQLVAFAAFEAPGDIYGAATIGGVSAAASFVCFSLDALSSASDAEELASIMSLGPSRRVLPSVSLVRGPGGLSPMVGLKGAF
jgi:hypothetical protein